MTRVYDGIEWIRVVKNKNDLYSAIYRSLHRNISNLGSLFEEIGQLSNHLAIAVDHLGMVPNAPGLTNRYQANTLKSYYFCIGEKVRLLSPGGSVTGFLRRESKHIGNVIGATAHGTMFFCLSI